MTSEQIEKVRRNVSINILEEIEKECGENEMIDNNKVLIILATVSYTIMDAVSKETGEELDKLIYKFHSLINLAKDEMSEPMKGFFGEFLEKKNTDTFVPKTIN